MATFREALDGRIKVNGDPSSERKTADLAKAPEMSILRDLAIGS